jgi:hypothetical protein
MLHDMAQFTDFLQNRAEGEEGPETAGPASGEPLPLTDVTNLPAATTDNKDAKTPAAKTPREPQPRKERGPPADGVPSKNKVMVANLPYDLSEEKVRVSGQSPHLCL